MLVRRNLVILLLDTHLLLWAAGEPHRLPPAARSHIEDPTTRLWFSAASIWEVTIKAGLGREDFIVEPWALQRGLLENGYEELPVRSAHAVAVGALPLLHRDPFDRLLVAQAQVESVTLMTADTAVAAYPGPIQKV